MGALDSVLAGTPRTIDRPPATARVVRSDATGVWVAPLGGDVRHPIGPCRGGTRPASGGGTERLPVGTVVLLVWTTERPWIARWEETS